jgi:hypothetical protein
LNSGKKNVYVRKLVRGGTLQDPMGTCWVKFPNVKELIEKFSSLPGYRGLIPSATSEAGAVRIAPEHLSGARLAINPGDRRFDVGNRAVIARDTWITEGWPDDADKGQIKEFLAKWGWQTIIGQKRTRSGVTTCEVMADSQPKGSRLYLPGGVCVLVRPKVASGPLITTATTFASPIAIPTCTHATPLVPQVVAESVDKAVATALGVAADAKKAQDDKISSLESAVSSLRGHVDVVLADTKAAIVTVADSVTAVSDKFVAIEAGLKAQADNNLAALLEEIRKSNHTKTRPRDLEAGEDVPAAKR